MAKMKNPRNSATPTAWWKCGGSISKFNNPRVKTRGYGKVPTLWTGTNYSLSIKLIFWI